MCTGTLLHSELLVRERVAKPGRIKEDVASVYVRGAALQSLPKHCLSALPRWSDA